MIVGRHTECARHEQGAAVSSCLYVRTYCQRCKLNGMFGGWHIDQLPGRIIAEGHRDPGIPGLAAPVTFHGGGFSPSPAR